MSKDQVLPQDGPTMRDIYDRHFSRLQTGGIEGARKRLHEPTAHVSANDAPEADAAGQPSATGHSVAYRRIQSAPGDYAGRPEGNLTDYTRDAVREIESMFPTVPNPTLVMYVFPHLSTREGLPVPGYSTRFRMYETDHYALPGEVSLIDGGE